MWLDEIEAWWDFDKDAPQDMETWEQAAGRMARVLRAFINYIHALRTGDTLKSLNAYDALPDDAKELLG